MFTINYRYLVEAQEYYKQKGYRIVDLKWVVPSRYRLYNLTRA